jgi:hypothetical protein
MHRRRVISEYQFPRPLPETRRVLESPVGDVDPVLTGKSGANIDNVPFRRTGIGRRTHNVQPPAVILDIPVSRGSTAPMTGTGMPYSSTKAISNGVVGSAGPIKFGLSIFWSDILSDIDVEIVIIHRSADGVGCADSKRNGRRCTGIMEGHRRDAGSASCQTNAVSWY